MPTPGLVARSFPFLALARAVAIVTAAAVFVAPVPGGAQPSAPGAPPPAADNYYAAGSRIEVTSPMSGDVVVAGRDIELQQPIAGDILAAGWRVRVAGAVDDDVRVAAGRVVIDAPVAGDLTAAGRDVFVGANTHVRGRTWLTGQTVRVDGVMDRDLHVAAATVVIAGELRQPVDIVAEKVEILPSARILGPLAYKSPVAARIAAGATVSGPVSYTRIEEREAQRAHAFPTASTVLFIVHLMLAGLLVLVFMPQGPASFIRTLRERPGASLIAGFGLLFTVPVVAVVLVISVLGLPIGLTLGAAYLAAIFVSVLATAFFVGDLEVRLVARASISQPWLVLLAGVLTLAFARALFGGLVVFVSVLFGLGALALWAYQAYAHRAGVAAPA